MGSKKLTKFRISSKTLREIKKMSSLVDYDGAGDGTRTRDSLLGRQELYH
jgi:hypothetical protein